MHSCSKISNYDVQTMAKHRPSMAENSCGFWRALKKALGTPTDRALQQFLQMYRIAPNPNTPMERSPAETMFARKVKSVFDKLIPRQAKFKKTVSPHKKHFYPGDKVLFKAYKNNFTFWEVRIIKGLANWSILSRDQKNTHKRHMNQLRKCCLNESEESPQNTWCLQ